MGKRPKDENDPSGLREFARRLDEINGKESVPEPEQPTDPPPVEKPEEPEIPDDSDPDRKD
jgi:hypothetical protein